MESFLLNTTHATGRRDRSLDSLSLHQASQWIWKASPPVTVTLGTFGNVTAIMIMSRMRSGCSAIKLYLHGIVCKLCVWSLNSCVVFSTWLLVVFTLHRAASVVWPHRVNDLCTRQKTLAVIPGTFLVVCLLHSHVPSGFNLVSTETCRNREAVVLICTSVKNG